MTFRTILTFWLLSVPLCADFGSAQGWEYLGPDSTGDWRSVRDLTSRFEPGIGYQLAAMTGNGIAVYTSESHAWSYIGYRSPPEPICFIGDSFFPFDLVFSPWDPDRTFLGYNNGCIEPNLLYQRIGWPFGSPLPPPGNAIGYCMVSETELIVPRNSDSLVYASACGFHRSTNRGETWTTLDSMKDFYFPGRLIAVDHFSPGTVYKIDYGDTTEGLYRSVDSGSTWSVILDSIPPLRRGSPFEITAMIAVGDTMLLGVKRPSGWPEPLTDGGVYRTTDGGLQWQHTLDDIVDLEMRDAQVGGIFAATSGAILRSTDYGSSWGSYIDSLPANPITALTLDPYSDTMYVSTQAGVLKVWNPAVGVTGDERVVTSFAVDQNYPNPFNPSTTIEYTLPAGAHVVLKLFGMLGEEIRTLVDEYQRPGINRVRLEAGDLPSGTYFYTLSAGGSSVTRKLVLVR